MSPAPGAGGASPWYAVHTKPRREETVRAHLERADITVFLPRIRETQDVQPLFPGYLFASFAPVRDRNRVRWTPGVRTIVGCGDDPVPVEDDVIKILRARHGSRGYIVRTRRLKRGEKVCVRSGPLAGLIGIVETACSGEERVRVLLELFRQRVRVEMEARSVAQVH